MKKDSKIFITDHKGLVGGAFRRALGRCGFRNLLLKSSSELNLLDSREVLLFFEKNKPDYVFLSSAKSGGIKANIDRPAEFLYHNLQMQNNVIHSAWSSGVKKLIFIGSSCVYPNGSPQPMKEEYLLTGALEPTSEPTAIAKIAGIKMCQYYRRQYKADFISCIPATIYGPRDDFAPDTAHVIPALIRRFNDARIKKESSAAIWGSGDARREFIHADDVAEACLFLAQRDVGEVDIFNLGTGEDVSIRQLAELISQTVGFKGGLEFDRSSPEGARRKLLDIGRLESLGWKARVGLRAGLENLYDWYIHERQDNNSDN